MSDGLLPAPFIPVQHAYVVPDLETACRRFAALYGVGPFLLPPPFEWGEVVYRGAAAGPVRVAAAFTQVGPINIELLQPLSEPAGVFDELSPYGGLHHVAVWAHDYETDKKRFVDAGYHVAMQLDLMPGLEISFIDTRPAMGHFLELYQEHPAPRSFYAMVAEQVAAWDGGELIREIG